MIAFDWKCNLLTWVGGHKTIDAAVCPTMSLVPVQRDIAIVEGITDHNPMSALVRQYYSLKINFDFLSSSRNFI